MNITTDSLAGTSGIELGKQLAQRLKRAGHTSPSSLNLAADLVEIAAGGIEYCISEDTNLAGAADWLRKRARDILENEQCSQPPVLCDRCGAERCDKCGFCLTDHTDDPVESCPLTDGNRYRPRHGKVHAVIRSEP